MAMPSGGAPGWVSSGDGCHAMHDGGALDSWAEDFLGALSVCLPLLMLKAKRHPKNDHKWVRGILGGGGWKYSKIGFGYGYTTLYIY